MVRSGAVVLLVYAAALSGVGCYSDRDFPKDPACDNVTYPQCPHGQTCINNKCVTMGTDGGSGPGTVITYSGSSPGRDNGSYTSAKFNLPVSLVMTSKSGLYVADSMNHSIRLLKAGSVSTAAGTGKEGSNDGKAAAATFNTPYDLAVADDGTIYVADRLNHVIRMIKEDRVSIFAGAVTKGYTDGLALDARFNNPTGIALDGQDTLYITDQMNHRIRKMKISTGEVSTYAGNGANAFLNEAALKASFGLMYELEVMDGTLYVADMGNHCIRKISSGQVTTHAGKCETSGSQDGTALQATFNRPYGLARAASRLYVADTGNHCIRYVDKGRVYTLAGGCGQPHGSRDGSLSAARFYSPKGVVVDGSGKVYVADFENHRIRMITP